MSIEGWTVYQRPKDYPENFVARRWRAQGIAILMTDDIRVGLSLEEVRDKIPGRAALLRFPRDPKDDRAIVETWL